jgi:hypothetical protein
MNFKLHNDFIEHLCKLKGNQLKKCSMLVNIMVQLCFIPKVQLHLHYQYVLFQQMH